MLLLESSSLPSKFFYATRLTSLLEARAKVARASSSQLTKCTLGVSNCIQTNIPDPDPPTRTTRNDPDDWPLRRRMLECQDSIETFSAIGQAPIS